MELSNLKRKVDQYKDILNNTENYRKAWQTELKGMIINLLQKIAAEVELTVKVEERAPMENLEAVVLSLGTVKSGMYQKIEQGIEVPLVKQSGSLIYQQL